MANSVLSSLDEQYAITTLHMLLSNDKKTTYVVVEGDDDVRMFKSLLDNNVGIIQSYHSKIGVESMVVKEFAGVKRVIGIRDKDYQLSPDDSRIFYCDYCCSEMMVVSSDECFSCLFNSYCNSTTYTAKTLRIDCLQKLEFLSELRCLNERNSWKVRFDGIKPSKLYNNNQQVMNNSIVSSLNAMNPNNTINQTRISEVNSAFPKSNSMTNLLDITNGHDFINIFHKLGEIKVSISAIESAFRSGYRKCDFVNTSLYKNLYEYQRINNLQIV